MEIKKIRAASMRDALFKVKKEIGHNAIIIHTKTIKNNGVFGFGSKQYVEITASNDLSLSNNSSAPQAKKNHQKDITYNRYGSKQANSSVLTHSAHKALDKSMSNLELESFKQDVFWIKDTLDNLNKRTKHTYKPEVPKDLTDIYTYLLEQEVAEELALELVDKVHYAITQTGQQSKTFIAEQVRKHICSADNLCEPIKYANKTCTKVALIGPTGVGKTTTIAKLAADFALVKKKKVSVITIDTYRIAAVEQLKTYMEIMDIPLEVVSSPKQMQQALFRQGSSDIILIDTAGRSQKNQKELIELKSFISAAQPDEVHLVLSSTLNYKNALDIAEKFSIIPIDKILFTKLDEAVNFGLVLNVLSKLDKKLSYLTTGQSVPDDIEPADLEKLSNIVLGGYKNV
ncbi:MAG: flagellar biosynthesis protein FlhF [Candidatus Omnitrophota bacterium]|nr:MAG: flagellar biosynthesis protein FlhF [Candidatus Omnitrophota bacterium]